MTEIAIAFDVPSVDDAIALDERLGAGPEIAKIGLELFASAGPPAVTELARRGRRVFLDLKLHDIPNTVMGAARAAARLGVDLITVHATGGFEMVRAAVAGAQQGSSGTRVVAVTILTSLNTDNMPPGYASPFDTSLVAGQLLELALRAGAAGIVCAVPELSRVRQTARDPFYAVTPGIRPAGAAANDQQRVATIAEAVGHHSDLIVIGRPITAAADPHAALAAAREERDRAQAGRASPTAAGLDTPGH